MLAPSCERVIETRRRKHDLTALPARIEEREDEHRRPRRDHGIPSLPGWHPVAEESFRYRDIQFRQALQEQIIFQGGPPCILDGPGTRRNDRWVWTPEPLPMGKGDHIRVEHAWVRLPALFIVPGQHLAGA